MCWEAFGAYHSCNLTTGVIVKSASGNLGNYSSWLAPVIQRLPLVLLAKELSLDLAHEARSYISLSTRSVRQ